MIYHDRCLPIFKMVTKKKKKNQDLFAEEVFIVSNRLHQSCSNRLRGDINNDIR